MSQASFQILTSNVVGEEPFIGDLEEGEIYCNSADGRAWAGDSVGSPIELGGAVKNKPIGSLRFSNYLSVDLAQPENLPVPNTNPLSVPNGFYREVRILFTFSTQPVSNVTTYFDYTVNWGNAVDPIDTNSGSGKKILVELSSFGPSPEWMGRLLWISN